jgi:intergrase/recombinase
VACKTCRRLLSSTCKSLRNGICTLCDKSTRTTPSPAADSSDTRNKRASSSVNCDDEDSSTTGESSSAHSSYVAAVERKLERRMEGLTSQFMSVMQQQTRKMEDTSRMFLDYIKSQEVIYCSIIINIMIVLLFYLIGCEV